MKLQIIVILLATFGIATGLAVIGDEQIFITVTSEGKAKVSQSLFPETFVSTIDVKVISENISNLLVIDEENIILGTSQNQELLKIATLGASTVDLKYNADILSYESGIFKIKYNSELESRVNLPPLSKLVSLNTIPIEITDEEYVLPPGDISLSFSIRPVTSKEFFVPVDDSEYKIEAITAAKIEGFSANSDVIQFIIKDKAIVLTIIPTQIMVNPNDASLNGEKVDFTEFHKNSTHSWIRIDPHEKGLVKILDTSEKTEEGGGCLIATATYGTEMAPQVQLLREIRDNQLMNVNSGVSFMTGFNSLYYSFSPHVADLERDNPVFKEIVKIGITPLLSSLSVMEYAETDEEVLGLGISVILMNIGMYFIFPFAICYQITRILRTRGMRQSSLVVISNCSVRSVLKIGLIGLIALFVLTVSIPSAFAQVSPEDIDSPIKMVLDVTLTNLLESIENIESSTTANTFYEMGQEEYDNAIDALKNGDVEAAEEYALIAMALFENSASVIGELEESSVLNQLPPGFGSAVGSASETRTTQGQGLGVGGIPPGIMKQLTASNVFDISEEITELDEEIENLSKIAESNGVDVNLEDYDKSITLARQILADGQIPNAQAQLDLAKDIKEKLMAEITTAAGTDENIQEYVDNQKNLGLTQKDIRELENMLDDLTTDDNEGTGSEDSSEGDVEDTPGNSGTVPGQNKADSGDEAPGNSGTAPGQNKDNSEDESPGNNDSKDRETPEDIPGFGQASETGKANGQGNGLGLGDIGKVPPGLAKLFGFNDETDDGEIQDDLPPGLANVPPGQAKKFQDYSSSFEQSMDDFYENSYESQVDDVYETNYDGTNKGNGDGKGKFGAFPGKSGEAPGQIKKSSSSSSSSGKGNDTTICHAGKLTLNISSNAASSHLANHQFDTAGACANAPGITDLDSGNTSEDYNDTYTIEGFVAFNAGAQDRTDSITFDVMDPDSILILDDATQPNNFLANKNGTWTITVSATGYSNGLTRNVQVGDTVVPGQVMNLNAVRDNMDPEIVLTWSTPSNGGSAITGYFIEIDEAGNGWSTEVTNTGSTSFTYTDSSLNADTEYCYRISAINAVGTGTASTSDCATTKK